MTQFKGFEAVEGLQYEQRVIPCKTCPNQCDVTEIKTPDGRLYHGDICERFSGISRKRDSGLPNYFAEREKIFMSFYHEPQGSRDERIGFPRVGVFNELGPFFFGFFDQLGLDVVLSDRTNRETIREGGSRSTAEFCFPIKVAFGHFQNLATKAAKGEIDYIFVPNVVEAYPTRFSSNEHEQPTGWERTSICPYLQNLHALMTDRISREGTARVLPAYLSFREGDLVAALHDSVKGLGFSKRDVRKAVAKGEEAYLDFKAQVRETGREVLSTLDRGVVIVGRPYTVFDKALNLNLVDKILAYGLKAIPQDFLPLPERDLSKVWRNEFAVQGQLFLNAAEVIKKDPRLRAVFLDYFGCGPNSFIRGFFQEQLEQPNLTLLVDEHTADAGVVTRLEAFLDSIQW
jgi:predicted nucleotide-binding protein (sugar kinase/HSP70/actin superfamily)